MEEQNTQQAGQAQVPQKNSKAKAIIACLVVMVLLLGVGYGVYAWQQNKVDDLESKVSSLNNELSKSNKKLADEKHTQSLDSSNDSQAYLEISQSGIKLPLTKDILDLSYTTSVSNADGGKLLHFTTKAVTDLKCPSDPLGIYSVTDKKKDNPGTQDSQSGTLVATVNGKYIYYTHAQYACGNTTQEQETVAALIDPILQAVKNAKQITN